MSLWHLFNYLSECFSPVLIIYWDSSVDQQEQSICGQTGMLDADVLFLAPRCCYDHCVQRGSVCGCSPGHRRCMRHLPEEEKVSHLHVSVATKSRIMK